MPAKVVPKPDTREDVQQVRRREDEDDETRVAAWNASGDVVADAHAVALPLKRPDGFTSRMTIITTNAAARANADGIHRTDIDAVSPMTSPPVIAP
ncbi:hypothetical protein HFX_2814 [Haloferax mediterranei ATCC 33500]|uniref:Uncharacterized protein n=1 Tax=Haloferax mediterranei (strain ATCC 33500 / DSM 1411 / JCM 8866 / NBRC 14739 / NCIMB 2177 / R-4) TaxID=523841 RepID=I3R8C8_HALMT|nr:hypothetical protein HFX_2814 [Haloferax mediterranei ATCC 33500]